MNFRKPNGKGYDAPLDDLTSHLTSQGLALLVIWHYDDRTHTLLYKEESKVACFVQALLLLVVRF